jgi:hypothetical protein
MKRLTKAQSELIDAFLAEHAARVSTAQLEKDFLISEVFSIFTEPVVYQGHEAKFVLCGGTAVSKAHRFTLSERNFESAGCPYRSPAQPPHRVKRHPAHWMLIAC